MAADIAPNSDSTMRYSQGASSPVRTRSESASTMCVWGEIGYAEITSGRQSATAFATASEPSSWLRIDGDPLRRGVDQVVGGQRLRRRCPRPLVRRKRSRIALVTDVIADACVSAANPPSSAAFGSGRPTCSRASSVAGTVSTRSARNVRSELVEAELLEAA